MVAEQVSAEERNEDAGGLSGAAVASSGGVEREEDAVSTALEVGFGPELGLRVCGGDDPAGACGIAVAPEVVEAHGLMVI
jgi:hypothetical protein